MTDTVPHISVCICSYKRAESLSRLLSALSDQTTDGLFTYSVIVTDNDVYRSAEPVVTSYASSAPVGVTYSLEPQQSIALARNKAVQIAEGEFIAFIDDDEFPTTNWLLTLFEALHRYNADGVLGPVKPYFKERPPDWVVKGQFYERQSYPTGFVIDGAKGRTGNVLLKKQLFAVAGELPFRPHFRSGEDQDFFTRMIDLGYKFIWCHEAEAFEIVPPLRWKRTFMIRRALLRGSMAAFRRDFGSTEILKSVIAVPVYVLLLPFTLPLGQHRCMHIAIRLFDHLGKLLALFKINPVREPYVTQ